MSFLSNCFFSFPMLFSLSFYYRIPFGGRFFFWFIVLSFYVKCCLWPITIIFWENAFRRQTYLYAVVPGLISLITSNFLSYPFGSLFYFIYYKVKCCMTNYDFYLFILTYLSEHLFSFFNLVVDGLSLSLTCIFFKPFGNPIDTFSLDSPYHLSSFID